MTQLTLKDQSPLAKVGPVIFLLSDLARHITGEILNINGGSVLPG